MKPIFISTTKIITIVFIILLISGLFFITGCPWPFQDPTPVTDPTPTPEPTETPVPTELPGPTAVPTQGSWTIMVYLDGDSGNLETYSIQDFNELEAVDLSGTGINIAVLLDRVSGEDYSNGDWTDTRLFHVMYDSAGKNNEEIVSMELPSAYLGLTLEDTEELNLGDPATVTGFIDTCKYNFPADNYMLIFWNHGSGWMKKSVAPLPGDAVKSDFTYIDEGPKEYICIDITDGNDALFTKEISESIAGQGISVVGIDACYEGMVEVAYEIRNDADYFIASEEVDALDGWEYDVWLNNFISSSRTPVDLVDAVVDSYATWYSSMTGATLSGIDLSQMDALNTALNTFSDVLSAAITTSTIQTNVRQTIFDVESYYNTGTGNGDLNIDLWDMADAIQTGYNYVDSEAAALKTAIESAVIAEWHNPATGINGNPNSHGLAIHYVKINGGVANEHEYHSVAYMKGYSWAHPLSFVQNSTWVPSYSGGVTGPGLLYTLWYDTFP